MNDPNNMIMDKSMRSVFVGNIPYEATEEKLKDIFSEVGAVGNMKYGLYTYYTFKFVFCF